MCYLSWFFWAHTLVGLAIWCLFRVFLAWLKLSAPGSDFRDWRGEKKRDSGERMSFLNLLLAGTMGGELELMVEKYLTLEEEVLKDSFLLFLWGFFLFLKKMPLCVSCVGDLGKGVNSASLLFMSEGARMAGLKNLMDVECAVILFSSIILICFLSLSNHIYLEQRIRG